jgi:competence protein ComEC
MKKIAKTFLALGMTLSMIVGLTGCQEFFEKLGEEISNIISEEIDEIISSIMEEMSGSIPEGFNPDDYIPDDENSGSADGGSVSDSTVDSTVDSTGGEVPDDEIPDDETPDDETSQLDIHFLELGNQYTGDCTYIKAGDTDILIDAGSRKDSATTITKYVNKYCTDGVLEYVIATHADQDHIAAFVGSSGKGIFDVYRIGTLIDFPRSDKGTQIYKDYQAKRATIIEKYGTQHYTALEWWKEEKGLTKSIEIADGITMNVLYQKYYENSHSDENNYSVCVMFSQGDNHYLFTGDLEQAGEQSLVASNDLPKVKLYKGGHHGSKTSSSAALMKKIQPEIVCVCCCAGSTEYNAAPLNTFPTQTFINNVAPYTDKIYVTTLGIAGSDGKTANFTSMNGNITVSSKGGEVTVNCTNNNTILKETAWFKANRTWPSNGV